MGKKIRRKLKNAVKTAIKFISCTRCLTTDIQESPAAARNPKRNRIREVLKMKLRSKLETQSQHSASKQTVTVTPTSAGPSHSIVEHSTSTVTIKSSSSLLAEPTESSYINPYLLMHLMGLTKSVSRSSSFSWASSSIELTSISRKASDTSITSLELVSAEHCNGSTTGIEAFNTSMELDLINGQADSWIISPQASASDREIITVDSARPSIISPVTSDKSITATVSSRPVGITFVSAGISLEVPNASMVPFVSAAAWSASIISESSTLSFLNSLTTLTVSNPSIRSISTCVSPATLNTSFILAGSYTAIVSHGPSIGSTGVSSVASDINIVQAKPSTAVFSFEAGILGLPNGLTNSVSIGSSISQTTTNTSTAIAGPSIAIVSHKANLFNNLTDNISISNISTKVSQTTTNISTAIAGPNTAVVSREASVLGLFNSLTKSTSISNISPGIPKATSDTDTAIAGPSTAIVSHEANLFNSLIDNISISNISTEVSQTTTNTSTAIAGPNTAVFSHEARILDLPNSLTNSASISNSIPQATSDTDTVIAGPSAAIFSHEANLFSNLTNNTSIRNISTKVSQTTTNTSTARAGPNTAVVSREASILGLFNSLAKSTSISNISPGIPKATSDTDTAIAGPSTAIVSHEANLFNSLIDNTSIGNISTEVSQTTTNTSTAIAGPNTAVFSREARILGLPNSLTNSASISNSIPQATSDTDTVIAGPSTAIVSHEANLFNNLTDNTSIGNISTKVSQTTTDTSTAIARPNTADVSHDARIIALFNSLTKSTSISNISPGIPQATNDTDTAIPGPSTDAVVSDEPRVLGLFNGPTDSSSISSTSTYIKSSSSNIPITLGESNTGPTNSFPKLTVAGKPPQLPRIPTHEFLARFENFVERQMNTTTLLTKYKLVDAYSIRDGKETTQDISNIITSESLRVENDMDLGNIVQKVEGGYKPFYVLDNGEFLSSDIFQFEHPLHYLGPIALRAFVLKYKISLEFCTYSYGEEFNGYILVSGFIPGEKTVIVSYTVDDWDSHTDIEADPIENKNKDEPYDKYTFELPYRHPGSTEFYLRIENDSGKKWWDFNAGQNYRVGFI